MNKASALLLLSQLLLVACKNEIPCKGYDACPVGSDLSGRDAPCCCGELFVDEEKLDEIAAEYGTVDTDWGCALEQITCTADGDLHRDEDCPS